MPDEAYTFANTRTRLEDIVTQVRKKDTSLEKSLDLLEEGVRLANQCTELIDHADWAAADAPAVPGADASAEDADGGSSVDVAGEEQAASEAEDEAGREAVAEGSDRPDAAASPEAGEDASEGAEPAV